MNDIDVNEKDADGRTPLQYAVSKDPAGIIFDRVEDNPDKLKQAIEEANAYKIDNIQKLLDQGADINTKDNKGYTPLHYAAMFPYEDEVIEYLLAHGAKLDAQTNGGLTPLFLAVEQRNTASNAATLLKNGADPYIKSESGNTPLDIAREWEDGPIKEIFDKIPDKK